ncbi:non-ribosomal peptide synthetase [Mycolicibacterium sp. CBMA 226]|uniref:non-ribosomal peptide synthetase n=1 Tax=Mycolicibacterium sp. CBMA 226 TaxID=2606611 RepID=UPI00130B2436|nr:non-ribosomal peptide synthetase [Mycolicibacterium sp. CBMA 226]MUL77645.1 amino acid adenylation domain-containing protein [Mycolicibacterium sp. CBMA 226]
MTETDIRDLRTRGADVADARLELLRRKLAERGLQSQNQSCDGVPVAPVLSDGQRRMWFVQTAEPSGVLLNVCVSFAITGELDHQRLRDAVNAVAARHAVLRTTYRADATGEPGPTVHDQLSPGWSTHDLSELSEASRALRLEVLAQREFGTPFRLDTESPLRISVIRIAPTEHIMLLTAHHIAWDDASWQVFFRDLTRAYEGQLAGEQLAEVIPAAVPADDHTEALVYWRAVLADPPEPLELPGPHGSLVPTGHHSRRVTRRIDADTLARISELARQTGATPYTVLLAVFGTLLHRYTHADDILVATPVLDRSGGTEEALGYYGNTVALRLRPESRQSFREFVTQAKDTTHGAFAHQQINLDRVVRELNPDRRHGVERLARVSFGAREADGRGFCPSGITCRRAAYRGHHTQLPLGFMVEFDADGALVEAEYLTEILDATLADQLLRHYVVLLESALADPNRALAELELMDRHDADWLRQMATGEQFSTPETTLAALIEAQAARTPDSVAVAYEGRYYSYRELNAEANRLAHWLIGQGIGTEDRVAVLLEKSPELVFTALAIVKAGGVYLPVDPTYPEDRLSFILSDGDPKLVIREPITDLDGLRDDNPTDADRVRPLTAANTAYLIYTSGSTGLPKGVPVPHRPVAEYFVWFVDEYQIDADERLLQVASPSFDVSIAEVFGMLACGARLVIPRPGGLNDIGYLTDLLRTEGITSMHFVPSLLGLFLSLPGVSEWRSLKRVPIGGEALPGEVADKFHATFDALLHNFYGPTETVINASRYRVEGTQGTRIVPIGKPKINTQMHLLDDALRPVPVGVIGEIYIGGTHVAHGYHQRPGLTAERFVADPFTTGGRLYRSGDLARLNGDGDIEFVGRADEQVKIRGFRIELGEIAAAIAVDPSVGQAVVVACDLPGLGKSLVGYLTPAERGDLESVDVPRIKARVAAALPEYMVPAGYVVLDEIPITAHGKIDRRALPDPDIQSRTAFRELTTDTERKVAELFADLLGVEQVGADDSFFELGGHSLLATKLVAAIRARCNAEIGVREVFELGTVAEIAARVDTGAPRNRPPLVASEHTGPCQMSASQLRQWFQYRIDGPGPVNNIPFAARITGPCDVDAFVAALADLVERHEVLRTTYTEIDGVPYQVVNDPAPLPVRRARGDDEVWLQAELDRERRYVFDLEAQWPIRAAVLSVPGQHVLSIMVHHIAADHWSAGVLFTDLVTAYRARLKQRAPEFAPLPVQYSDYAAWQAALLADESGALAAQRDYWRGQLAEPPADPGLRPDFTRPPVLSGEGSSVPFVIDPDVRAKLTALTRELGITDFMLLQSAVAVALAKSGEGLDIPLGTPVAGRTEAELDALVGFFINILVLRNDLSGDPTLREILVRSRDTALAAYAHQDLPFDHVVDAVSPARSLSRNPLFGVVVHVREDLPTDHVIDSRADGDTTFTALEPTFDVAHADLSVNFFATQDSYRGHLIYRTDLYTPETARHLADRLVRVIAGIAEDADQRLRDLRVDEAVEGRDGVLVLDEWRQPVGVGVVGDIYQGSEPTGERGRWLATGQLERIEAVQLRAARAGSTVAEPARTDTERALIALLAEVLDAEAEIGRGDDYFSLGGDSIKAVQLAARGRDAGMKLTARMVFEYPMVHELAAAIDARSSAETQGTPGADREHAPMTVSGLSAEELDELTASFATSWTAPQEPQ